MSPKPKVLLPVGAPAPDFSLHDDAGNYVALSDFIGSPVVLLFYTADFHPVCTSQVTVFNEALLEFHRHGAQVVGISRDNVWSHIAFSRHYNVHFPLLSDFYPMGEVGAAYQVPVADGESARAVFVIDKTGRISWSEMAPAGIAVSPSGAIEKISELSRSGG